MINTFVFMGMPGSGKGKQSEILNQKTGFQIFSTGGEMRNIAKTDNVLGNKLKEITDSGELAPAWLAAYVFQHFLLSLPQDSGVIFEGVGRKEPEAKLFNEVCEWLARDFRVLHLNVSKETAITRLNKRRGIEGRLDDDPSILENRFKNFYLDTEPAINYFRSVGKVIEIDGEPLPDVVASEIDEKIKGL